MRDLSRNQNAWFCALGVACLVCLAFAASGTTAQAGGTGVPIEETLQVCAQSFATAAAAPDAIYRITTTYAPLQEVYLGYAGNRRIVVGLTVTADGYQEAMDALNLHGHVPALAVNTGEGLQANRVVREGGRVLLRFRSNDAYVTDNAMTCGAQNDH